MNAEDLKRRHNLLVTADRYDDLASLLTRAGVGATSLDGRLLSPAERVEMALMRGHA